MSDMSGQNSMGRVMPQNLSECAQMYARSLADPFTDYGACIPDFPALFTGRFHTFSKGTFSTSSAAAAAGTGFIVIDPARGIGNDANAVKYNAATSTATQIDLTTGANLVSANTNSPYGSGNFQAGNNQQWRIVSAGLRIRYIGNEFIRGGQVVGLSHPAHYSLHTYTSSILDSYLESSRLTVTRDWINVVYHPVDTDDLDWNTAFPTFTPAVTDPSYFMGFLIKCPDTTGANALQFEFEAHFNYEVSGPLVQNKEVSHVDPVGHGAVNATAMLMETIRKPHKVPTQIVADGAVTAASHYVATQQSNPSKPAQHPAKVSSDHNFWSTILKVGESLLAPILSVL